MVPAATATAINLRIYKFHGSVDGAQGFVDLNMLYRAVLPAKAMLTASEWIHTWFKWWQKALTTHELPQSHLRKALPTRSSHYSPKTPLSSPFSPTLLLPVL
eukprot:2645565-Amphidinium_carterae.2